MLWLEEVQFSWEGLRRRLKTITKGEEGKRAKRKLKKTAKWTLSGCGTIMVSKNILLSANHVTRKKCN